MADTISAVLEECKFPQFLLNQNHLKVKGHHEAQNTRVGIKRVVKED